MIYIYDIIINLQDELIEFFEWNELDEIKYIRKIPLYKVNSDTILDFTAKDILFDPDFLINIKELSDFYNEDLTEKYRYLTLVSDGKLAIALCIMNGKISSLSRMLLDEEAEVLKIIDKIEEVKIPYLVIADKIKSSKNNLTRKEYQIKNELLEELNMLSKTNDYEKLYYYYYEYFDEIIKDAKLAYKHLFDSITNKFNQKHIELYNIIKLSHGLK